MNKVTAIMGNIFGSRAATSARKYADKHVTINYFDMPEAPAEKIMQARETIANYAKSKDVNISFYSAQNDMPELHSAREERLLSNKIAMRVSPNKNPKKVILDYIDYTEKDNKPFLRTVYERLQYIVEGKPLRIKQEMDKTLSKVLLRYYSNLSKVLK